MQVTPAQLKELLTLYIPKRLPVLITGRPGIGKSDIVEQVARDTEHELLISHPVVEDPTDSKGLPFPSSDGLTAKFLPFGDLERALSARRPLIWFLDDLGQASPAVQAAKMQLLLARRIGEHILPSHVTFVAATNRRTDNAGVTGILDPVISRFASVVELAPTIDEWTAWAVTSGVPPALIAFLRFRPDLLSVQKTSRDIENSCICKARLPKARTSNFIQPKRQFSVLCVCFPPVSGGGSGCTYGINEFCPTFNPFRERSREGRSHFDGAQMERDIFKMMEAAIATMQSYIQRGYVLANGLSGGKYSTCVMVLMLEAIRRSAHLFPDRRHFITSADTTIENPVMQNHLYAVLDEVEAYAERTVYFEESAQFEVDAEAACAFVTCSYDTALCSIPNTMMPSSLRVIG